MREVLFVPSRLLGRKRRKTTGSLISACLGAVSPAAHSNLACNVPHPTL